ncbi:MAG: hypothetical protein ABIJ72_03905, partial [bacterium]
IFNLKENFEFILRASPRYKNGVNSGESRSSKSRSSRFSVLEQAPSFALRATAGQENLGSIDCFGLPRNDNKQAEV